MKVLSSQWSGVSKSFFCFALCAVHFAFCAGAEAQQPAKLPRIGFLSGSGTFSDPAPSEKAFRQGLRDLGYVEEKNVLFEFRYAEGRAERAQSLVSELVQLKVDVLVVLTLPSARAAKEATKTIPIVMVLVVDPVETGLIDSLARPGGNITGIATHQLRRKSGLHAL